jgi:putative tricarboxylic transport membrane protein
MCAFAATIIFAALTEGGPTFGVRWKDARWTKPVVVIACLIAFALALEPLGFLLSSIPLMLLLMRLIDPVRWEIAIPVSLLVPTGMWWLLKHGLGILLPSGMFEIG